MFCFTDFVGIFQDLKFSASDAPLLPAVFRLTTHHLNRKVNDKQTADEAFALLLEIRHIHSLRKLHFQPTFVTIKCL